MKALLLLLVVALGCTDPVPPRPRDVLVVSQEQQAAWIRNFNPFLAPGLSRFPTRGGIYEPLLIWNTMRAEYVPWLATAWTWRDDARTLEMTLRGGVRFSDGTPFSSEDVELTFKLLGAHRELDLDGVWSFLASVEAQGPRKVVFRFTRPFAPGLYYIGQTPIVPAHIWRDIENPVAFANPTPIATGPFTQVDVFESQIYQLGRNPYYWQGWRPVAALRFPAYSSNEQANLALIAGEVDWAGNFVPAIDRVFVGANPEHHHYWFPGVDGTIVLYANTKQPPLDDARVRKALSLAIDRELLVEVAMYGHTRPSDASGLDDGLASWRDPLAKPDDTWVRHDPIAAGKLLDEAGCLRGADGVRSCKGVRLEVTLQSVSGWSDWVRGAQVIARDLSRIGVSTHVRTSDFTAWFDRLQRGNYELSLGWTESGPTPYPFYRGLMSSEAVRPIGTASSRNWNRYGDREADAALAAFERSLDPAEQRRLARAMAKRFAETAPVIPLFPSPSWAEYSTARFVGFPSASEPYARPTPNRQPECLLVLTKLRPRP
ncbi:MAG TPA: ABC transporter substrate-binding protein [Kofleriaceae bacterium]